MQGKKDTGSLNLNDTLWFHNNLQAVMLIVCHRPGRCLALIVGEEGVSAG